MPLARRRIGASLDYGHPDLYQHSGADTMLQDVTMASSTGTLVQIGLLSVHAAEMFRDIMDLAEALQGRLESATTRVRTLHDQLPRVCDVVEKCDGNSVHRSGVLPEPAPLQRVQFTVDNMPTGLREAYDALPLGPDFSRIDALLSPEVLAKEGPSAQKYSHPGLFLDAWKIEEVRKMEEVKRRRQEEKEERRRLRKSLPRRDPKTVPRVVGAEESRLEASPRKRPPPPMPREPALTIDVPVDAPLAQPSPADVGPAARESEDLGRFVKMLRLGVPRSAVDAKMAAEGLDPSILDDSDDDSTVSPASPPRRKPPPPPPPPKKKPPPPPPKKKPPPPPMPRGAMPSGLPGAPTPQLMPRGMPSGLLGAAPPPPMPRGMPSGLLGAIQQGSALKAAAASPKPLQRPESALLLAIKSGGALRKVVQETRVQQRSARGLFGGEVDKILALRARVGAESDTSSASDDDEWGSE